MAFRSEPYTLADCQTHPGLQLVCRHKKRLILGTGDRLGYDDTRARYLRNAIPRLDTFGPIKGGPAHVLTEREVV